MAWGMHDARISANSSINKCLRDEIRSCMKAVVENKDAVPIGILGDAAYPLLSYLMREFPDVGSTVQEQLFSYRSSSAMMVIECAFERLKARFSCLRCEMDVSLKQCHF